jgi:hypothetical protein
MAAIDTIGNSNKTNSCALTACSQRSFVDLGRWATISAGERYVSLAPLPLAVCPLTAVLQERGSGSIPGWCRCQRLSLTNNNKFKF